MFTVVTSVAIQVPITISGTATSTGTLKDYTLNPDLVSAVTYVTIASGQNHVDINLSALNDDLLEDNETVIFTGVTLPAGFTYAGGFSNATVTIADQTPGDIVIEKVTNGSEPGGVGNNGRFIVKFKRDNVTCTKKVKVTYVILEDSDTAREGIDYQSLTPHEVTINIGAHETYINIDVINNYIVDGNREVVVKLTGATKE